MNTDPFADPWKKSKTSLAPPMRKAPVDIDWDAFGPKNASSSSGSSKYMEQLREQDPWPTPVDETTDNVSISNSRFLAPDDLVTDESCTLACDVKILNPPTVREVQFSLQYRMADAENGRFEVTGLGKEFISRSEIRRSMEFDAPIGPVPDTRVQPSGLSVSTPRGG